MLCLLLTIGAVLLSKNIYDAFANGSGFFQHGHTYMGHPLACAAGLATLDIYRDEKLFERAPIYDERGRRWMEIAVGVWDGRKYTPMHRNEAKARGAYISKWHGSQAQYVHLKKISILTQMRI